MFSLGICISDTDAFLLRAHVIVAIGVGDGVVDDAVEF